MLHQLTSNKDWGFDSEAGEAVVERRGMLVSSQIGDQLGVLLRKLPAKPIPTFFV